MSKEEIIAAAFKAKPVKYPTECFRYIVREGDVLKFQFLNLENEVWVAGNDFEKPATKQYLLLMGCP